MHNNVAFMMSTDNESALSIAVKHPNCDKYLVNDMVNYVIENAQLDEIKTGLTFRNQCRV